MFDEVLKFGSYIVDQLVAYKQPVFVYLAPKGELRGGAWVVVDETINSDMMEMYADRSARGNVLEPAGAASIKFRRDDILQTMHRLDPTIYELSEQLAEFAWDSRADMSEERAIQLKALKREEELYPVFKQVSLQFADLHDRPGRMVHKSVIRKVIDWPESRMFFYKRLKARLLEHQVFTKLCSTNPVSYSRFKKSFQDFLTSEGMELQTDENRLRAAESGTWQGVVDRYIAKTRTESILNNLREAKAMNSDEAIAAAKLFLSEVNEA